MSIVSPFICCSQKQHHLEVCTEKSLAKKYVIKIAFKDVAHTSVNASCQKYRPYQYQYKTVYAHTF